MLIISETKEIQTSEFSKEKTERICFEKSSYEVKENKKEDNNKQEFQKKIASLFRKQMVLIGTG